ncbi:MAG: CHAT domain-containing protein [Verrucomicrobiaceae bacterium]
MGKIPYRDPAVPNLIPRCHAMVRLAATYHAMGDSLMAEKYYRLAVDDGRRLMGFPLQGASYDLGKFAAAGRAFSSLGGFYTLAGDHRRAIPLLLESIQIRRNAGPSSLPSNSMDNESSSISLSRAYLGIGEVERAKRYSYEAMQRASLGPIAQRSVVAKSTLASAFSAEGEYDKALELTGEMMSMQQKMRKDDEYLNPSLVNNTGWLQLQKGDHAGARKSLMSAYQLLVKSDEQETELGANVLTSLAMIEFLEGNPERGLKGLRKANAIYEAEVDRKIGFGSDSQKLAYLQKLKGKTNFLLGMAFKKYPENEEVGREALVTVLRRKGRMTRLLQQSAQLLRASRISGEARKRLVDARAKLSLLGLSLGVFSREGASEFDQDWMVELEEAERAINELVRKQKGAEVRGASLDLDQLAAALGDDEVLLEYVVFRPYREGVPKAKLSTIPLRCGVFVMNSRGKIQVKDLGDYGEIRRLAVSFRRSVSNPGDETYRETGKVLYGELIEPIRKALGDAKHWRVAPDGQLSMIPFGALIGDGGRFLEEEVSVTYVSSGSELLVSRERVRGEGEVTIFAAPEYSLGAVRRSTESQKQGFSAKLADFWEQISAVGAPLQFPPLPGTVTEAKAILKLMPEAKVLGGVNATEGAFREAVKGGIVHVATHGFYLNDELISSNEKRGLKRVKPRPQPGLENVVDPDETGNWIGQRSLDHPLLNCGLVFSGANQLFDGRDDGVLTGMEVLNLDLRGTDLVVLSACETGVGEVVAGEGVLGLNQAFRVAGASSLVTSFWKVSDEATAALMAEFYSGLSKEMGKGEALRSAAGKIRGSAEWQHPAYWAAFSLSGDVK